MKIICERQDLIDSIGAALRAVSTKSSIPALEGILVTAEETIRLSGYDLELGIECATEGTIKKKGSVVLSGRMFGDIVRKLPDGHVTIETDDSLKTTITCGLSEFVIIGSPSAEFPEIPKLKGDDTVSLPQNLLKDMIRQTVFSVSQNENKPVHTGCLFDIKDGLIKVVAVDGSRLALRTEKLETPQQEPIKFVVPGKTLNEIGKLLADSDAPAALSIGKKQIVFEIGNITLFSRLLEGEFINYENAIPKASKITVKVSARDFADSVERISLLISERLKSPIRINFGTDRIKLSCITPIGKAQDEINASINGEQLEIGFNNRFILDALKNCEREEVLLELNSPLLPMVIKPADNDGSFIYLVLPVRLKSEN